MSADGLENGLAKFEVQGSVPTTARRLRVLVTSLRVPAAADPSNVFAVSTPAGGHKRTPETDFPIVQLTKSRKFGNIDLLSLLDLTVLAAGIGSRFRTVVSTVRAAPPRGAPVSRRSIILVKIVVVIVGVIPIIITVVAGITPSRRFISRPTSRRVTPP